MLRVRIGLLCLAILLIFGMTLEAVGKQEGEDAMCVPMGDIELKPPASVEARRSPVNFPHARHFNNDCKSCHHKWEGDAKIRNCTTSGCHDRVTPPKTEEKYLKYSDASIKYFKYAFHSQCIGCHKEIKEQRKAMEMSLTTLEDTLPATGPTGCKGCHPAGE